MLNTMESPLLHFHSTPLGELPPPAPRDCFGRDELIEKVVKLAENLEPIALIGAGGIGKTSIALTVLHHSRIKDRFGDNRRFIRCDQFPASRADFLARLSEVIGVGVKNPKDLTPLRHSLSSKEMFIILDNAESILDPQGKNAREIYSVVDELCQFKTISLCITSRIMTVPRYCKRPEIPTLSMEAACDIFYGIYGNRGQSDIIDDLLRRLDFHALSIALLATTASHNGWDYDRLAKEWDARRARVLQTDYNESLAATIELSLASPTFHSLGPSARDLVEVIAFFPQGIDEKNLDWLFPTVLNRKNVFDKLCVLSLTYRSNGFVTMLAPLRDYLNPQDPQSSPLLCATRDRYFGRLSVDVDPDKPGFREARWIVSEDVNVEQLLDVFTSADRSRGDVWDACYHFMEHLYWHKPRKTLLGSKIEALPDHHRSKPKCLSGLSQLVGQVGNFTKQKLLLSRTLELERRWGDDSRVAQTLQHLSLANRLLHFNEEGIQQAKEASEIFERIGDTTGQARCLNELSYLFSNTPQLDAAEDAASRGIKLISEKYQGYLFCDFIQALGIVYRLKGEKAKAIHHFETVLRIASPPNWRDTLFWTHCDLAELFQDEGEFDDANVHLQQAKSHAVDDPYQLGRAMYMQACVWYQQRRLEEAKSEVSRAVEILERHGAADGIWDCRDLIQRVEWTMENRSTSSQCEFLEAILRPTRINFYFPGFKYTLRHHGECDPSRGYLHEYRALHPSSKVIFLSPSSTTHSFYALMNPRTIS
jgi:tetratricopeptide (TPR) repeat protein